MSYKQLKIIVDNPHYEKDFIRTSAVNWHLIR